MHRRIIAICLTLAAVASLASLPAAAGAKKHAKKAVTPSISRVQPMRLSVGEKLTIRGKNFNPKRKRNTVVFRSPSGRSAFAKPSQASRTKLVVTVPAVTARLLATQANRPRPTRFTLRVLSGRFSKWTSRRLSPVLLSPGAGKDGLGQAPGAPSCGQGDDWDGDLLSNGLELQIKTDPCVVDSDADGISDGYEEQSAIDLNHYPRSLPLPYPGKRPFPNALDPTDASTDYDGDGLDLRDEYLLWSRYAADGIARISPPASLVPLLYSDGLQKSIDPPPAAPPLDTLARWALEMPSPVRQDGLLDDDERDGDGDGLGNWDESHGRMMETWWAAQHDGTVEPMEAKYPGINFLDVADLPNRDALADPDIDGDRVPDGADDSDHDGLSNQFEVARPPDWLDDTFDDKPDTWNSDAPDWKYGPNPWAFVNPFNPCKPFDSERCHDHPPFGWYAADAMPFVGPPVPPGYPDVHPETPNGY